MQTLLLTVLRYSWQYFVMLGLGMYILFQRADLANCRADNAYNEMALEVMKKENTEQHQKVLASQKLATTQYAVDTQAVSDMRAEKEAETCEEAIGYLVNKAQSFR